MLHNNSKTHFFKKMNFCSSLCSRANEMFVWFLFGTNKFVHGNPEELERLVRKNKRIYECNRLVVHEHECEVEDDYDVTYVDSPAGPVRVRCRHCEFDVVVGLESLLDWKGQFLVNDTLTSISAKIGKAKVKILRESTVGGNKREKKGEVVSLT